MSTVLEMQGSRRWARATVAAVGLTVATAVIAMAASAPLSRSAPVNAASARAPVTALFLFFAGAGVVALAGAAALIWPGRRRKRADELELLPEPLQVHWFWKLVAGVLPLVLGAVLIAAAVLGVRTVKQTQTRGIERSGAHVGTPAALPPAPRGAAHGFVVPAWLPWTVAAIVVVAISLGVVLLVRWRQQPAGEPSERTAVHHAVESAIGALGGEMDPRNASIAAYAAMEGTLAAHGIPRPPAEAPREYLRRVLVASSATESEARTLTKLFEEARFSTHPISERVREVCAGGVALAARATADRRHRVRLLAEIGLIVIAAAGVAVCFALLAGSPPARRRRAAIAQPTRPEQLVRLEHLVGSASTSAVHAHAYLRPVLAEIASRRLAARGQTLERIGESDARQALGDPLWELIRPDRPFPEDRYAPGVSPQQLKAMLERLERL